MGKFIQDLALMIKITNAQKKMKEKLIYMIKELKKNMINFKHLENIIMIIKQDLNQRDLRNFKLFTINLTKLGFKEEMIGINHGSRKLV